MTEISVKAKYFMYSQNNSGGSFIYDQKAGIGHYVIIEAIDAAHANTRAQQIGIYFNGCETGMDCSCCGDRWSEAWNDEQGDEKPMIYGRWTPDDYIDDPANSKWGMAKQCFVHYISGQITMY